MCISVAAILFLLSKETWPYQKFHIFEDLYYHINFSSLLPPQKFVVTNQVGTTDVMESQVKKLE
jgi:hypothetical protein